MKEFRVVIGSVATPWLNASEWTIKDLEQFIEFKDYYIEYR